MQRSPIHEGARRIGQALEELDIPSGMTAPHRPRDLDDVIQLIRRNGLSRDYAEQLNGYVRDKYSELWDLAQIDD